MIGQTISHYKILEKLGEGGMGVVYKAEDINLKRTVALKFLPKGLQAHELEQARFLQEAQAASALNHPNICAIHTLGEYEGRQFIDMEFVDGKTLKQVFPIQNMPEAITYAIQIAEALQEAHNHGIVHRDVKPENIMLNTKKQIKVMDFGLAKLKGSLKLTRTSSTVGTLAYMAPEQIRGEEADSRCDIFSFGIVLYEMLTGYLPFRGEHEAAMMYSIMNEEPQPISHFRVEVPSFITSAIERALQKDPALRYQTMQEMIHDLKTLSRDTNLSPKQEKSIVVLPFENLSPDPDQEYFSDGLTEEVISDLSAVRSLRVISRSSAMTFKGTKKKVPEIARELNVRYVLEGSVRKAENSLRITAQLIDAANDFHLWAEKFSGTIDDVFDVQEKVSRAIVTALKLKLTPEESRKIAERPIDNVAAYQCYLRANVEIWQFEQNSLDRARVHLQTGLDILGPNALLYSAMGMVYFQYVNIGVEQEDYIEKAKEYSEKALALDPDSPQGHFIMGMIGGAFWGNSQEWIRQLKTALAINPNYIDALRFTAGPYIISFGKLAAAKTFMQRLQEIDPLDPFNHTIQGMYLIIDGQYAAALDPLRRSYEADPDNPMSQFFFATALLHEKRFDEAFSVIDRAAKVAPENACTKFSLMLRYSLQNDREKTLREMTPEFQKTSRRDHQWSYFVAIPLALLDAREESLDWLENAVNKGFINYPELERNPYLDNLRDEERFKKLLKRVRHEWEHFEV